MLTQDQMMRVFFQSLWLSRWMHPKKWMSNKRLVFFRWEKEEAHFLKLSTRLTIAIARDNEFTAPVLHNIHHKIYFYTLHHITHTHTHKYPCNDECEFLIWIFERVLLDTFALANVRKMFHHSFFNYESFCQSVSNFWGTFW